jgi:hypothetical protein
VIDVGTSTWRHISGSLSFSSMRTEAISLKLLVAAVFLVGLRATVPEDDDRSYPMGLERATSSAATPDRDNAVNRQHVRQSRLMSAPLLGNLLQAGEAERCRNSTGRST